MRKIREVLRLRFSCCLDVRGIAASCQMGKTTVGEYIHRAEAAGLKWPLPEELCDKQLERLLYPPPPKKDEPPRPRPDWSYVHKALARKGVTLLLLWREYKKAFKDGYGYSRYAQLYREWEKRTDLTMLQRHKAGEKMFVDFAGLTMPVRDPRTGEDRRVQIYVSAAHPRSSFPTT